MLGSSPLILHVLQRARDAKSPHKIVVASDAEEVLSLVRGAGAEGLLTSERCATGTDRAAEALSLLEARGERYDLVINVQGDEPFLEPEAIDQLHALLLEETQAARFKHQEGIAMATLARKLAPGEEQDPNLVKVVCDRAGHALYFSRAAIGSDREGSAPSEALAHLGLYAFSADALRAFPTLAQTPLEKAERLEQLRALEHGWKLRVGECAFKSFGIDTPTDLERARERLANSPT